MQKRISRTVTDVIPQKRSSALVPGSVVYVGADGEFDGHPMREWSADPPASLSAEEILENILSGAHWQSNVFELLHCLPEVRSAVHQIASRVSDAVWEVRRQSNDEPIYSDAAFNRLFSSPNPTMNIRTFIYNAVTYEILTGRTFFFKNQPGVLGMDYKNIIHWWVLPAHRINVKYDDRKDVYTIQEISELIRSYEMPVGYNTRTFEPNQVLPVFNFNINTPYDFNGCCSLLTGARKAIKNLIAVYEARGVIYIKRGAMGFIVSAKGDESGHVALTPSEKRELEAEYNRAYGLQSGKSQIGFSAQPVDYVDFNVTIKDLMPFDETLSDAVAIYSVLNIPRHLVPSKDAGTFANANTDEKSFYTSVIIPFATKYAELFTNGLGFSVASRYVYANYSHIHILQEDKKAKAEVDKMNTETAAMLYEKGVITKNRRNAMVGEETVGPDGDVYSDDGQTAKRLIESIGIGGVTALQAILADMNMSEDAKIATLQIVFGISKAEAKRMTIPKPIEITNDGTEQTNTEGSGESEEEVRTDKLPGFSN